MRGLGVGAYPRASGEVVLSLRPPIILAMDWDPAYVQERGLHVPVVFRHWEPDQVRFERSPEQEGARWARLLARYVGELRGTVHAVLGPNEYVGEPDPPEKWAWAGVMESTLANLVHSELGLAYYGFSLPPGNGSDQHFAIPQVANALETMDALCYHGYGADPRSGWSRPWELEPNDEKFGWYFWRPMRWSLRKPLFLGEVGTWVSWKAQRIKPTDYINLCIAMAEATRQFPVPVLGVIPFALGAEGEMGRKWNIEDGEALALWRSYNERCAREPSPPPPNPPFSPQEMRNKVTNHVETSLYTGPDGAVVLGVRAPYTLVGRVLSEKDGMYFLAEGNDPHRVAWVRKDHMVVLGEVWE